jgi:hypothetical protein
MAWEQRGNGSYYYGKRWEDGRCVSTYLGSGALAHLAAASADAQRAEAEQERSAEQERRHEMETRWQVLTTLSLDLRHLTHAVLLSNGYHQHKRQWRRQMERKSFPYGEMVPTAPAVPTPDLDAVQRGLRALGEALKIAAQPSGKQRMVTDVDEALAEQQRRTAVRGVLRDYPCIWPHLRQQLTNGEDALIKAQGCDPSSATGQVARKVLNMMRTDLGYDQAPLLEQLLIEHVALAWLDFDMVQILYARGTTGSHTLTSGAYWDRRLNSAQHRYLRAVETLARVRRLAQVTPLQVNIGGQQVNVVGTPA